MINMQYYKTFFSSKITKRLIIFIKLFTNGYLGKLRTGTGPVPTLNFYHIRNPTTNYIINTTVGAGPVPARASSITDGKFQLSASFASAVTTAQSASVVVSTLRKDHFVFADFPAQTGLGLGR